MASLTAPEPQTKWYPQSSQHFLFMGLREMLIYNCQRGQGTARVPPPHPQGCTGTKHPQFLWCSSQMEHKLPQPSKEICETPAIYIILLPPQIRDEARLSMFQPLFNIVLEFLARKRNIAHTDWKEISKTVFIYRLHNHLHREHIKNLKDRIGQTFINVQHSLVSILINQ